ncbi:hypothetical protein J2S07_003423 [Robertmurraya andreesenii]|uniref:Uncharacterized protein n=1 Tax=Anoxybacillus andreesenii TaxID=1325932 RepID=A0ABT9V8E1_9BACL|nr:hypothetical protein [Robertmurraya andreesenii]
MIINHNLSALNTYNGGGDTEISKIVNSIGTGSKTD